ncbi:hypothetical protein Naga_100140g2 [Nannochloropsis gaditana]|uniref:Uncharacterized protein n=1 Tax=Nannochloropsis gaditana TaxID=72520 RepID=W7TM36_9STRA|nr:hypothetical protein Naga_100140g2 [Nannochloropsis gaditana]
MNAFINRCAMTRVLLVCLCFPPRATFSFFLLSRRLRLPGGLDEFGRSSSAPPTGRPWKLSNEATASNSDGLRRSETTFSICVEEGRGRRCQYMGCAHGKAVLRQAAQGICAGRLESVEGRKSGLAVARGERGGSER